MNIASLDAGPDGRAAWVSGEADDTAIQPTHRLNEVNGASAPLGPLSGSLPFVSDLDLVPQAVSDAILHAAVFGSLKDYKGPGPRASSAEHARAVGALRSVQDGRSARAWLIRHGGEAEDEEERAPRSTRVERPKPPTFTATQRARARAQAAGVLQAVSR